MIRNRKGTQKPDKAFLEQFKEDFRESSLFSPRAAPAPLSPIKKDETSEHSSNTENTENTDIMGQSLVHSRHILDSHDPSKNQDLSWAISGQIGMDHQSQNIFTINNQNPFYNNVSGGMHIPQDLNATLEDMLHPLVPAASSSVDPSVITNQPVGMGMQQAYGSHLANTGQHMQMGTDPMDSYGRPHSFVAGSLLHRNSDLGPLSSGNSIDPLQFRRGSASVINDQKQQQIREMELYNTDFRFQAVLRASTAMTKDPDEIPITYLNKGQAYTLTISDTASMSVLHRPTKYRTHVRISFEEDEQRSKPAACWQLWQEGRGANEAHHRDGKLLAVEHVDPNQGGDGELRHSQVKLENANFDGFSVLWTPNRTNGRPECSISVRFNFLSTDFSHSKGVKGIPVRLCAKTQVVAGLPEIPVPDYSEVMYCKVKLFRDHGAERKLSNDATHVKKQIEKIKSQLAQSESGGSSSGEKRKRNISVSMKGPNNNKVNRPKTKGSWTQGQGEKPAFEDDLSAKLQVFVNMFRSVRLVSVLNLKGDALDDPEAHPVKLEMSSDNVITGLDWDPAAVSGAEGGMMQSFSPASSHQSLTSSRSFEVKPGMQHNSGIFENSRHGSIDWTNFASHDSEILPTPRAKDTLSHPVRTQRQGANDSGDGWFEALGVRPNYNPPPETMKIPKHCFYVKFLQIIDDDEKSTPYYHAIYLQNRNYREFVDALAHKWKLEPSQILRILQVRDDGLQVVFDDDVIQQIPEGKDMTAELVEANDESDTDMIIDSPRLPTYEIRLKI